MTIRFSCLGFGGAGTHRLPPFHSQKFDCNVEIAILLPKRERVSFRRGISGQEVSLLFSYTYTTYSVLTALAKYFTLPAA
jgi:hypothetical protein